MAVSTVSYSKTPQAGDDVYSWQENDFLNALSSSGSVLLDVMSNDLGGNAKQLYSIDNGDALKDLLTKDPNLSTTWEKTAEGNEIRINNGKIEFKLGAGFNLNTLAEGQSYQDTFTYSIQLGNGTISCATVKLNFVGQNDAAVMSSANVSVQETNATLTTSGDLTISDIDSAATFQAQTDVAGANGKFSINAAGHWTYTANEAFNSLNVGQSVSDTFTVLSADGTATTVKVTINGTNDAAVLSSAVVALAETNAPLTTGGTLTVTDVDSAATFQAQSDVAGANGKFSIDTAGNWTYTANQAFDGLNVGQSVSDTFTVLSADGTATSVKVTINGTNDAAVLSSAAVELDETNAALTTGGTLTITDVDSAATFQTQSDVAGANGKFSIDAAGNWTYAANEAFDGLNVGQSVSDTFTVLSADGTATSVQVTIKGTNDAAVLSSATVELQETNAALSTSGQLTNTDVDNDDTFVAQSDVQGTHGKFSIDTAGNWTYAANEAFDGLNVGQSVSDTFAVHAADGTTTSVQVTIKGTNDAAVLSSAAIELSETNEALATSGTLTITDVDSAATFQAQTDVAGVNGKFSVDAAGNWTYAANGAFDGLNVGQSVSDTFAVLAADGTATLVQVTIKGTNDAAVLSSAVVALNETDAALVTGGQLTNTDVDNDDTFVAQSDVQGTHGKFSIGTDGTWSYQADSAYDALNTSDSVSDTFSVAAADGTPTSVEVTITGTNDAAVLSSADVTLDEVDSALTTGGTLTNQDVDNDDTFVAQTDVAGANGKFSIDAAGTWTYTANEAFDALNIGDSVTDTFSVAAADGTLTSVKVTIKGTNDAAVLSAEVVTLAETNEALTTSGTLTISDVDSAETFVAQNGTQGTHGKFSIGADGAWNYTADSAFDALNVGNSVSDTFTVAAPDGTLTSVKVTINGSNDAAVLSSATVALDETNAALTTGGTLTNQDVDNDDTFVAQSDVLGDHGKFSIDTAGQWTYAANEAFDSLNVGDSVSDLFTVAAADGTTTTVEVTINGTNDDAVLSSAVVSLNETNAALTMNGTLTISDVDSAETFVAQTDVVGTNGKFSIDAAGAWSYAANSAFDSLNVGQSVSDTFTVHSADGTASSVKVTIDGTNDAAVLSSADVSLTETNAVMTTGGTLTNSDVDDADTFVAQTDVEGTNGKFSIDAAGAWTYTANSAFDGLAAGQSVSDTFTVHAADGTASSVKVTINGTNDAAILSSADVTLAETNAPLTTGGTLTITDVDSAMTFQAQSNVQGTNGKFSIGANGAWTYTADSAYDSLNVGDSISDTFTVKSFDGTSTTVKVTINGTADGPVAAPAVYAASGDTNDFDTKDIANIKASAVNFTGSGNNDEIAYGSNAIDTIDGRNGADKIYGFGGNDNLMGGPGVDEIYGGAGNDSIQGGSDTDTIYGGSGNDTIQGDGQADIIFGGSGSDIIVGNAGADIVIGGFGADVLTGGTDADTFRYLDIRDTGDMITDFNKGEADKIDFASIDTGTLGFTSNTTVLSSHSVITFFDSVNNQTVVQVDTDGNASTAELQIQLTGNIGLVAADFLL